MTLPGYSIQVIYVNMIRTYRYNPKRRFLPYILLRLLLLPIVCVHALPQNVLWGIEDISNLTNRNSDGYVSCSQCSNALTIAQLKSLIVLLSMIDSTWRRFSIWYSFFLFLWLVFTATIVVWCTIVENCSFATTILSCLSELFNGRAYYWSMGKIWNLSIKNSDLCFIVYCVLYITKHLMVCESYSQHCITDHEVRNVYHIICHKHAIPRSNFSILFNSGIFL